MHPFPSEFTGAQLVIIISVVIITCQIQVQKVKAQPQVGLGSDHKRTLLSQIFYAVVVEYDMLPLFNHIPGLNT